ncbi:hypothetical protein Ndes2437A_g00367 [Nannochloris sp. 'desiccata']
MLFQQTAAQEPYVLLEETGGGYIAQPSGHEVFYDEAAGLLHIVEGRMVSAVALPGRSSAAENKNSTTAAATSLSSSSSLLLAPLSTTPESQQRHQEGEENKGLSTPSQTPISALHRRTVSDAVSIASTTTSTTPSRAFLVSSGPPITAVRASLDGNFTALQRSKLQIEFLDHSNGNMFVETPQQNKSASAVLHGFFWTDAPEAEFVLVTSMGLELYSPKIGSQSLKYTAFQRLSAVQWFIWSHSTRILVAGCGSSGAKLQAFQFSRHHSGGVARLSMLDLTPPWGSPTKIPSKSILNQGHNAAVHAAPWLLVSPTQIWVLLLYRRVFIAYHDLSSNTLKLYRIYRDSTALFAECPLKLTSTAGQSGGYHPGPGKIELSVVEDVLVVHFLQQHAEDSTNSGGSGSDRGRGGTAVLFDIAGEGVRGPTGVRIIDPIVSTPTQLGVILLDGGVKVQENEEIEEQQRDGEVEYEHGVQQQKLSLFHPALALDQASGRIFRLRIDLLALSEACFSSSAAAADRDGDILSILAFLHRRQERRYSGQRGYSIIRDHRRDPRHVILRVLRRIVNDRASPALLRSAFDAVLAPLRRQEQQKNNYKKRNSDNNEKQEEDDGDDDYRSVHAKEIALGILAPALQLTSPRPAAITPPPPPAISNTTQSTAAANYVLAALSELFTSCYATGNYPVNADVASLYLTAYSNAGREYLLPGLLTSHAQLLDSTELAERLASGDVLLARHDKGSSISNTSEHQLLTSLALDMYTRLGNHKQVCKLLLQQGNVLAAVKHAQLFLMVDPGVLEDPEHIFNAAYSALNNSTSMSRGGEEDNKVLKIALGRILEDKKTKFSCSSYHPSSSSAAAAVDALAATSSQFLDQQTASLVEALENF